MDLKEIQNLIKFVAKSGTTEVKLETDDFKITIKNASDEAVATVVQPAVQHVIGAPAPAPMAAPAAANEGEDTSNYLTITSPMIGTFYRKPAPDKPLFANVGDEISPGKVVCIIEAMKLFNEIEAEVSGKIVKILVEDGSPVEYDQPLFLVDPS